MHALSKLFEALHLTRKGRLSGGHYRRRRQTSRRSSFLSCETLESKQLLAADVAQSFATVELDTTGPVTVAIEGKFQEDTVSGTVVKFDTNAPVSDSDIYIELAANTPLTNANFLSYVNNSAYDNTMFHRSVNNFVLQGGGFTAPTVDANQQGSDPVSIPTTGTVNNEPGNLNTRGTIAMAKLGELPDSATSQFFFNLNNNSFLDSDNGGYTVFGEVLGSGMSVVNTMALAPTYDATTYYANTALGELPLYNTFSDNIIRPNDFLKIENADVVTESDLMTYVVESSDTAKLTASFDGNGDLVLTPVGSATGSVDVTVTATSKLDSESDSQTFSVQLGSTLTAIETAGNTILNGDEDGLLYAGNTPIFVGATHVTQTTFSGYTIIAAEVINAGNQILLEADTGALIAWTANETWSRTGEASYATPGSDAYYAIENDFGMDIDGGGIGQAPLTAVESDGRVVMNRDNEGRLYAGNTPIYVGATHVTQTTFSPYLIIGADVVDSENQVLVEGSTGELLAWTADDLWVRTGQASLSRRNTAEYYETETNFSMDIDGGGIGQAPFTAVESNGSVVMNRDADGKLYAGNTPIYVGATHVTQTTFNGFTIVATETIGDQNQVLLKSTAGTLISWSASSTWSRTGEAANAQEGTASFYNLESNFGYDSDGGGVGYGGVESAGSVSMTKDGLGKLYANGTPIYVGATHVTQTTFTGFTIVAAESIDGANQVLLKTNSGTLISWSANSTWSRTGEAANARAETEAFYNLESKFDYDSDGGGAGYAEVETQGSVSMTKDGLGKLYANGTPIYVGATHVTQTTFSGFTIVATETIGDQNQVLLKSTAGTLVSWSASSTWSRTGEAANAQEGTASFYNLESNFGYDSDGGGIGAGLTAIESFGQLALSKDDSGKLYAGTTAIYVGSTHVTQTTFTGYTIIAAEVVDSVNQILLQTDSGALLAWSANNNWLRTGQTAYARAFSDEYYSIETDFSTDVDGGGVGQSSMVTIESDGLTTLKRSADNKLYIGALPILVGSTHVTQTTFAGYTIVAAETVGSVNQLLLEADNGALIAWTANQYWARIGQAAYARTGSEGYYSLETDFSTDLDGGGVGQPGT
jgi:cyclophilin family peptidyl-prolyl cis-trans isomerase